MQPVKKTHIYSHLGRLWLSSQLLPSFTNNVTKVPYSNFNTSNFNGTKNDNTDDKIFNASCKTKTSYCEKSETSCKMPLMDVDENHEGAKKYFRTVGKAKKPIKEIWVPLDFIHNMDEPKPRTEFKKTWKECPPVAKRVILHDINPSEQNTEISNDEENSKIS